MVNTRRASDLDLDGNSPSIPKFRLSLSPVVSRRRRNLCRHRLLDSRERAGMVEHCGGLLMRLVRYVVRTTEVRLIRGRALESSERHGLIVLPGRACLRRACGAAKLNDPSGCQRIT